MISSLNTDYLEDTICKQLAKLIDPLLFGDTVRRHKAHPGVPGHKKKGGIEKSSGIHKMATLE